MWRDERAVTLPPGTGRRVLVDLEDYVCAYPVLVVSGGQGGSVAVGWAESLSHQPDGREKGNRAETEGRWFFGVADAFLPDGALRAAVVALRARWRSGATPLAHLRWNSPSVTNAVPTLSGMARANSSVIFSAVLPVRSNSKVRRTLCNPSTG